MLGERHAVPDVRLVGARRYVNLQLAHPLTRARNPSVGHDGAVLEGREGTAAAGQARSDPLAFVTHGRNQQGRGLGSDLRERRGRRSRSRTELRRPERAANQKRKGSCRMELMTCSSTRADPPGKRWKNVSTASAASSNLITASLPSELPFSGSADHLPSFTVARHLPPHGPRTSIP